MSESVRELSERYSQEALYYRDLWAPVLLPLAMRGVEELGLTRVERVVEIGTGVGMLLPVLRSRFPEASVLGIDRSPGMLVLASKLGRVALMDALELAFASGSFDAALMNFVLFHLPDPVAALSEANRVLRPGGQAVTVTWGGDLQSPATLIWDEELDAHGAPPLDTENTLTRHDWVDTPEKVKTLFERAGFARVRAWQETCAPRIDAEHLIALRTHLGRARPRYDALSPEARESCVTRARRRFLALSDDAFVTRGTVVYAIGVRG